MRATVHEARRDRVRERLGDRAVMVLAAAPELHVGYDVEFRYAADPELFYLSGHTEPEAVLVLSGVPDQPAFTSVIAGMEAHVCELLAAHWTA